MGTARKKQSTTPAVSSRTPAEAERKAQAETATSKAANTAPASAPAAAAEGQAGTKDAHKATADSGTKRAEPSKAKIFRPGYPATEERPKALRPGNDDAEKTSDATSRKETGSPDDSVKPPAEAAKLKTRHRRVLASFILLVILPIMATSVYLWVIAKDQYASTVAFSIRKEELSSSMDLLGGQLAQLGGAGGAETDILYEFIRGQELVSDIDKELDLEGLYSAAWPEDPVFAYNPEGTVEDLIRHWKRKVQITYDTGTGLMTLRVLAFDRDAAQSIAQKILDESTQMINALSDEARRDATRYAEAEVGRAVERLKEARSALTAFRLEYQIVDPEADLQGQMGVLNSLQAQLADSLVELDMLAGSASPGDPRIRLTERRIEVIEGRIAAERQKFGAGGKGPGGEDYATIVAEFERLTVDLEFAEETYRAALVSYDDALAKADRKSFYLSAHIDPTLAERSDYPKRWTLLALTGFFLLMAWSIAVLIYYSIRDRR